MGAKTDDLKEKILTVLFFTGIFFPVRVLFYTYVSEHWAGSFGLMTVMLVSLIYLARKGKLGYLGRIINRQVLKFSKGKYGKISMILIVFWIYIYSNAIYGIEFASDDKKSEISKTLEDLGVDDMETLYDNSKDLRWDGPGAALGIFFSLVILLVPNSLGHSILSIMNEFSDGWILHFVTVFLVEDLEILALMIYFRYVRKNGHSTNLVNDK